MMLRTVFSLALLTSIAAAEDAGSSHGSSHDSSQGEVAGDHSEVEETAGDHSEVEEVAGVKCAAGWPKLTSDKWCASAALTNQKGSPTEPTGVLASSEACAKACRDDMKCKYYLYKHDPDATWDKYHCATFASCDSYHPYNDGNGGKICMKEAAMNITTGWAAVYSKQYGEYYWWNADTDESIWKKPADDGVKSGKKAAAAATGGATAGLILHNETEEGGKNQHGGKHGGKGGKHGGKGGKKAAAAAAGGATAGLTSGVSHNDSSSHGSEEANTTTEAPTEAPTTTAPADVPFTGSLSFSAGNLSETQVNTAVAKSLAKEFDVNETDVSVKASESASARRLRASMAARRLAGLWNVLFEMVVPNASAAKAKASALAEDPSSFGEAMTKNLKDLGVSDEDAAVNISSFAASEKPAATAKATTEEPSVWDSSASSGSADSASLESLESSLGSSLLADSSVSASSASSGSTRSGSSGAFYEIWQWIVGAALLICCVGAIGGCIMMKGGKKRSSRKKRVRKPTDDEEDAEDAEDAPVKTRGVSQAAPGPAVAPYSAVPTTEAGYYAMQPAPQAYTIF